MDLQLRGAAHAMDTLNTLSHRPFWSHPPPSPSLLYPPPRIQLSLAPPYPTASHRIAWHPIPSHPNWYQPMSWHPLRPHMIAIHQTLRNPTKTHPTPSLSIRRDSVVGTSDDPYTLPVPLQHLPSRSGRLCFQFDEEGSMLTAHRTPHTAHCTPHTAHCTLCAARHCLCLLRHAGTFLDYLPTALPPYSPTSPLPHFSAS